MSGIFLFTTIGMESGQLLPIFAVAQQLTSRGHRVRMLLGRQSDGAPPASGVVARAEAAGCETAAVKLLRDDAISVPPVRHVGFGWTPDRIGMPVPVLHRLHSIIPQFAACIARELQAATYDAVVADCFLPGAFIAAEAVSVPAVSLVHSLYQPLRRGVIPGGPGFLPPRGPLDRVKQSIWASMHEHIAARNALPGLNAARTRYGLRPVRNLAEQEDVVGRILVMSCAEFDFQSFPLPANVRFTGWPVAAATGGSAWDGPWAADDGRPLVLLSPSTSTQAQEQVPFFQRAIAAMCGLDVRGVLTSGPSADASTFLPPPNVVVVPFVPHASVLSKAAFVMSHCGHGTVMTALSYGVPVLCVPWGRDQYDVAARVLHAGAGIQIDKSATTERIRNAIGRMLSDPRFSEAARRLATTMSVEDGARNAADEIESVAAV